MAPNKPNAADSDRTSRALVAASPDLLMVVAGTGTFLNVLTPNHSALWMPAADVIGKGVSEILPPPLAGTVLRLIRLALDTGDPQSFEYGPPQPEGATGNSSSTFEARFVATGPDEVVVVIRDVAARVATFEALKNAETAALDSEARLRAILNTTADGIISMNEKGVVLSFNRAAESIFQYSGDEVVGRNLMMLMPEPDRSLHDSYLNHYSRTGEARIIGIGREVSGLRRDGSVFPMELEVGEVAVGDERMFTGIVRDITQRIEGQKARALAERKYQDLFESAVVGMYQATPSGSFISCNRAMAQILGYDSPEGLMESVSDISRQVYVSPASRERYIQLLDRFGVIEGFETEMRRRDGEIVWTSQNTHAVYEGDGDIARYEGVVQDITARKAAEREIEETRRRLEDANQDLLEANLTKDTFLSTVSHELRTPLTSVKGFAEILQAYGDIDEASRNEFIGIIANESNRLIRLINDLLDLSKIEAGKMEWEDEPVSVEGVIDNSVASTRSLALEKQQKVEVTAGESIPDVMADPDKLIQVMTNLLSNAFKFSPAGSTIRIIAKSLGDEVVIGVEDQGIGIAPGDVPLVFERFIQVGDTLTDKPKGTGLGLPICKEIVDHYGGRIWVKSEYEVGSTFPFALPALLATVS
jgi:two-component system, sensor histidine kinase and response regulator